MVSSANSVSDAQYINIGTGGADLSSSFFLPNIVGWGKAALGGGDMTGEWKRLDGEFDEKTIQDAEYCLSKCPACRPSRHKGMGFLRWILKKTEGSCEKCVAYEKVYGVKPWEKPARE